jgi:hypothetical protein
MVLMSSDVLQRLCQTASADEMSEILEGYKRRCELLRVPYPEMAIVDNCCHVRNAITRVLPDTHVVLDVYHFLMRWDGMAILGISRVLQHTSVSQAHANCFDQHWRLTWTSVGTWLLLSTV